jgi:hypothetical protein
MDWQALSDGLHKLSFSIDRKLFPRICDWSRADCVNQLPFVHLLCSAQSLNVIEECVAFQVLFLSEHHQRLLIPNLRTHEGRVNQRHIIWTISFSTLWCLPNSRHHMLSSHSISRNWKLIQFENMTREDTKHPGRQRKGCHRSDQNEMQVTSLLLIPKCCRNPRNQAVWRSCGCNCLLTQRVPNFSKCEPIGCVTFEFRALHKRFLLIIMRINWNDPFRITWVKVRSGRNQNSTCQFVFLSLSRALLKVVWERKGTIKDVLWSSHILLSSTMLVKVSFSQDTIGSPNRSVSEMMNSYCTFRSCWRSAKRISTLLRTVPNGTIWWIQVRVMEC